MLLTEIQRRCYPVVLKAKSANSSNVIFNMQSEPTTIYGSIRGEVFLYMLIKTGCSLANGGV